MYQLSLAEFSPCEKYRYHLLRMWNVVEKPKMAMFVGLNPSTADASVDDPTVKRCVGYAKRLGCDGMHMMNIFAYRATDPAVMKAVGDPVGELTDEWLKVIALDAEIIVCCWGTHGKHLSRGVQVERMLKKTRNISLFCFGLTATQDPKHPLYLRSDQPLICF